jgi:UDP-N-acetylglucosamine 2-epimerase (non-hydrolysing)
MGTVRPLRPDGPGPIVVVAGARPNFVKVAPILRALALRAPAITRELVHTGQHYDAGMSDVFFEQLGIPAPSEHLNVGSGPHGAQTARVLVAFEEYLTSRRTPRGVVVVGDVNSTLACALAAVKLLVPVAHVEAGLRSFDRTMPEEINRVATDAIADLLLTSEPSGEVNLRHEGVAEERIRFVGNVMIDTLVRELPAARALRMPASRGLEPGRFALVTLHRPSNVDGADRLEMLAAFLERVARRIPTVFPAHPRTRASLERFGLVERLKACPGLALLEPLGYRENLGFMADAKLVVTDSGGMQEETTFLGVPCLTLRPSTERPVTVTEGTNTVVGEHLGSAEELVDEILADRYKQGRAIRGWDGKAAERVADVLVGAWG